MKNCFFSLLFIFVLAGCAKVKGPDFKRIGNFKVKSLDLTAATIGFDVTYFNPNNFGVTVKQAGVDIYIDSLYLGKFMQDSTVGVGRSAEFSVPLSGAVPLQKFLQLDFKHLGDRDILLRVDGSVKVGKAGIFVSEPIHYSGMHRLDEIKIRL
jgi:LEA14-like dessication related protein